jgi:hypothetical protein
METILEEYTTEEQRSRLRFFFCWKKGSMQRIFIKKFFLFIVGSFCRVKWFRLGGKRFADDDIETEVREWRGQQSKDFYAAGFDALVKRWDKCINVGGI